MSSIDYHFQCAVAARLDAIQTQNPGDAAMHVAIAEMHDRMAAEDMNDCLAPFASEVGPQQRTATRR